jgi:hypothetical protein
MLADKRTKCAVVPLVCCVPPGRTCNLVSTPR